MPFLDPRGTGECEFREIVGRIETACDMPDVDHHVFRLSQTEHKQPRTVVWVPLDGSPVGQTTNQAPWSQPSKSLRTEWLLEEDLTVEARITGTSCNDASGFEDAERIRRNVVAAFRFVTSELRRKSEVGPHVWMTQQDGQAAHMHGGTEVVVQRFAFRQLLPKSTHTTVEIQGAGHSCSIER